MNNELLRHLSLITLFAVYPMIARGQWVRMNTGTVNTIRCILADDAIVFAGTDKLDKHSTNDYNLFQVYLNRGARFRVQRSGLEGSNGA